MPADRRGIRRRWYRTFNRMPNRARTMMVIVLVLALLACAGALVIGVSGVVNPSPDCQGATTVLHEGPNRECVGITDGSFVFDPALKAVEQQIRKENRQVTGAHPGNYVSVVLLLPISSDTGSIMSTSTVLEQLRGAYVAQHYANGNDVQGLTPYIQLLLGNNGYQANQWSATTTIIEHAVSARHIAAVAGLGVSLTTTQNAVQHLTAAGIPVVGATLTSDNFDSIKNFIRVSPSNKDEVSVALSYIKSRFTN